MKGTSGSSRPVLEAAAVRVLCEIAERAGRAIMDVYDGPIGVWQKADSTPLTEADLKADRIVREGLERHFPGVFILSEESTSSTGTADDTLFLVDPLDGTKEFLKRNGEFTVNIALVDAGAPVAGVVFAPALGELFWGIRGAGAHRRHAGEDHAITVLPRPVGTPVRVVSSRSHGDDSVSQWLARLPDHTLLQIGSSLKFCRIAEGKADVYPRFGPTSQWDTAAAQAVLEAAGGSVKDLDGHALRYGLDRPIINPSFIAAATPSYSEQR